MFGIENLFGAHQQIKAEKSRLEAFLSAVPGEYCGFSNDGSVVYSQGFCDAFGLVTIEQLSDLQNVTDPQDALALEGVFSALINQSVPFELDIKTRSGKQLLISGTRGENLSGSDVIHILWLREVIHNDKDDDFDLMQEALDALPYPVWIREEGLDIKWCNVAYCKNVNMAPSEIIAQQKEIISVSRKRKPDEKDLLLGRDLAAAAQEQKCSISTKVHEVHKGSRILYNVTELPVVQKNITLGFAQDITHEEELFQEIDNNKKAYYSLLEQLRSAIAIYDTDQRLSFYNSSFAQLWSLEEGWLNTKPKLGEIMEKLRETRRLPEQADFKSFKNIWIGMFTSLIEPHEDMLYLPDGSALRMFVVPHKLGGLMMTFEDVSSRLELESSYNTLVAVQKETLDNLEEAVTVYGGDGRLKLWNPAFASLWGFEPETLSGEPHVTQLVEKVSRFFNDTDWLKTRDQIISLALERSLLNGRMKREDNKTIDYSTLPLSDGGVLVTFTDITDTIRVENALREKNVALETAEKLKLDFLANVSYQLRTPLSAIMGFNEMLAEEFFGSLNDKQKEYTSNIQGASERLLGLINDVLDLSTIEAGQMNLEFETVSVKDVMDNITDLVTDWVRKESLEFKLKCPANIGKADMDKSRIKQAILNLIRNSIDHSLKGDTIELSVKRSGDMVHFSVQDNGAGISDEDQRRVLEPFEKVESVQNKRGAGLGLTLVKNIVNLHGGNFELSSEKGKGTRATIKLPKKQSA